jgi:two-component system OmpR family response regulator
MDAVEHAPSGKAPERPHSGKFARAARDSDPDAPTRRRVLYVEDEAPQAAAIGAFLREAGFEVDTAADAPGALALTEGCAYDLALVDLRLPGAMDGHALARRLRADRPAMGIVMHTVVAATDDKSRALEVCDDYIVKSCEPDELVARLRAVARRSAPPAVPVLSWGPFRVHLIANRVWVDGVAVDGLQPLHVRFLAYLIQNAGRICTHDELRVGVFGAEAIGDRNCARVVSVLRGQCGAAGRHVVTVKGTGYGLRITE